MENIFGKLIIIQANEDAKLVFGGHLVTETGIYPVKLWHQDPDKGSAKFSGAAYDKLGKEAEKLFYISVYVPNEEKKYALSATIKEVGTEGKPRIRAFLYDDYNIDGHYSGGLVAVEVEETESAKPAEKKSTGKKRMF